MKRIILLTFFIFLITLGVALTMFSDKLYATIFTVEMEPIEKTELDLVYSEKVVETLTDETLTEEDLTDDTLTEDLDLEGEDMADDPETDVSVDNEYIIQNIDYINQVDDYPTGCESVAAVMALNFMGVDISVDTFIDDYLDMGNAPYYSGSILYAADPWEEFIGNPRSSKGYGCYSTVIENAINKFIDTDVYSVYTFNEFTYEISLETLCKEFINQDTPVLIWATASMASVRNSTLWTIEGTSENFQWLSPMHCLLLVGYDEDYYYFHDSLQSAYKKYSKSAVETAYEAMGAQALVITQS